MATQTPHACMNAECRHWVKILLNVVVKSTDNGEGRTWHVTGKDKLVVWVRYAYSLSDVSINARFRFKHCGISMLSLHKAGGKILTITTGHPPPMG